MARPRVHSAATSASNVDTIVDDLLSGLGEGESPAVCLCAASVTTNVTALAAALQNRLPKTAILGTSSCLQVATDQGAGHTAAALFLSGDGVRAGAASGAVRGDSVGFGEALTRTALARAEMSAEHTRLVVVHASPGQEEAVLTGLGRVIPDNAVVIGGSGADDDLSEKWTVFGPDGAYTTGAAIMVVDWPYKMAVSYQGGYLATEFEGRVTSAEGRRIITIDGRPAADVYAEWRNAPLPRGRNILKETTLNPLGIAYGVGGGLDVHVLVHPSSVDDEGALHCFAEVKTGDRLLMMEASVSSLVRRGGLVARFAMQQAKVGTNDVVGALMIYCAGCLMALGEEEVGAMTAGVVKSLPNIPFLMPFTYGEQGRLRRSRIDHGNLMLSALILTSIPDPRP